MDASGHRLSRGIHHANLVANKIPGSRCPLLSRVVLVGELPYLQTVSFKSPPSPHFPLSVFLSIQLALPLFYPPHTFTMSAAVPTNDPANASADKGKGKATDPTNEMSMDEESSDESEPEPVSSNPCFLNSITVFQPVF